MQPTNPDNAGDTMSQLDGREDREESPTWWELEHDPVCESPL